MSCSRMDTVWMQVSVDSEIERTELISQVWWAGLIHLRMFSHQSPLFCIPWCEYYALSPSMWDVFPSSYLVIVIAVALQLDDESMATLNTTVRRDNIGAPPLATLVQEKHIPLIQAFVMKVHLVFDCLYETTLGRWEDCYQSSRGWHLFMKPLPVETFVVTRGILRAW